MAVSDAAEDFISSVEYFPAYLHAVVNLPSAPPLTMEMWKDPEVQEMATQLAIDRSRTRIPLFGNVPLYYFRWNVRSIANGVFLPTAAEVSIRSLDALMESREQFIMDQKRFQKRPPSTTLSDLTKRVMSTEFAIGVTTFGMLGMMRCIMPLDLFHPMTPARRRFRS